MKHFVIFGMLPRRFSVDKNGRPALQDRAGIATPKLIQGLTVKPLACKKGR